MPPRRREKSLKWPENSLFIKVAAWCHTVATEIAFLQRVGFVLIPNPPKDGAAG
jgi:hypothetical protein